MSKITGPDGKVVKVTDNNRLEVSSISEDISQRSNLNGNVFSIQFAVTPVGANDFFFHFQNTGTKDIIFTKIRMASTVITQITIEKVTGTPTFVSATDASVTNRNLGSSLALQADSQFDTDITVITSDGILLFEECSIANTRFTLNIDSSIVIPQGQAIAFKRVAATGLIDTLITAIEVQ